MIVYFLFNTDGCDVPVFVEDTESGYTGIDVLVKPQAYKEVTLGLMRLQLADAKGSINGYSTQCMPLILDIPDENFDKIQFVDLTEQLKQVVSLPSTAASMVINRMDEASREQLNTALEVLHYYETVTTDTKVFLPEECFQVLGPDIASKMRSVRSVFALQSKDNKEIIQKDCNSNYGIVLPTVESLHSKIDVSPSALDILRVIAPYRREVAKGAFQYNGVYHTPYYRVDPKIRGMVPSYLKNINGLPKNNELPIQSFEKHMYDNLFMFIMEDVSYYINDIVTSVFLLTPFGQQLRNLFRCQNEELLQELFNDIMTKRPDGVEINVTYTEIKDLYSDTFEITALSQLVKSKLKLSDDYIGDVILPEMKRIHVVDIDQLPFVIELSDSMKELATQAAQGCCITLAMLEFCISLCLKAYEVNWGHTGATRAIPHFGAMPSIQVMDRTMSAFLSQMLGQVSAPSDVNFKLLYKEIEADSDDDDMFSDDADEASANFDYYITNETAQRIVLGTLPRDYFNPGSHPISGSKEAAIVEYWHKVNGNLNLSSFISNTYLSTGSVEVLLEAFYKLMRWGDNKPTLLVFDNLFEVRTVFDLNTGEEIQNTAIVDESALILYNGCKYHMEAALTAQDVIPGKSGIVGFLLSKNYGEIKKYTICSWVDIGESIVKQEIDIDLLKTLSKVDISDDARVDITATAEKGCAVFTSAANISKGLHYDVVPAEFSELALLQTAGILRSSEYMKSKQNTVLITTRDRQYDILTRYCNVLRKVTAEENVLSSDEISTNEISAIAVRIYELFNAAEGKEDANDARSSQAVKQLNIDLGTPSWDESELVGKFALVSDMEMESSLTSIEFSNEQVKKLAMKLRDRVVLLMLDTPEALLLCRKDVQPSEISIVNHNVEHRKYTAIAPAIKAILGGKNANITARDGTKKPIRIHSSLGELL